MVIDWFDYPASSYPHGLGEVPEWLFEQDKGDLRRKYEAFLFIYETSIKQDFGERGIPWTIILPHPKDSHPIEQLVILLILGHA